LQNRLKIEGTNDELFAISNRNRNCNSFSRGRIDGARVMSKEDLRLLIAKTKSQRERWKHISNQTVEQLIDALEILSKEREGRDA
jgi:hypothetical protein|tara:strand:+ start:877 stop:1131 length:255 start_codon:yes stop_codon:yes gene_type:complete